MNWNGTDRRLQEAQKRADDKKWTRRREDALQEKLDAALDVLNRLADAAGQAVEIQDWPEMKAFISEASAILEANGKQEAA